MVKEFIRIKMEIFMMENGLRAKSKVKEYYG